MVNNSIVPIWDFNLKSSNVPAMMVAVRETPYFDIDFLVSTCLSDQSYKSRGRAKQRMNTATTINSLMGCVFLEEAE